MSAAGVTYITNDIVQVQIPLPYRLNIVNCYLLRGSRGWTLLDTGLNTAAARAQWKAAMNALNFSAKRHRENRAHAYASRSFWHGWLVAERGR